MALSKERIVEAAMEILDDAGEGALTFRALAARLATGSGAIYWHVADKDDLMTAATEHVIDPVLAAGADPRQEIRSLALGIFDAIDAHPWAGACLARAPMQPAMLRLFESIGGRLHALGVAERDQFNAASALVSYILGCAGQNASNARHLPPHADRAAILSSFAARLAQLDPADFPFLRRIAGDLAAHDDREQFLAGIDLILSGIDKTIV